MPRPRQYEENSRVHLGTRFDKGVVEAFDALCRVARVSRTQALECVMSQTIKAGAIPPLAQEVFNHPTSKGTLRAPGENTPSPAKVSRTPVKKPPHVR